tara:strand:- start:633 stop:923 length:291 start_codon:yes stop_codon:yes gene_type:complete
MEGVELTEFKNNKIIYDLKSCNYIIECPHCDELCAVHKNDIRCTVFRHAVYKKDFSFVYPHATKEQCDSWVYNDEVYGCGKPFIFDGKSINKCGYI